MSELLDEFLQGLNKSATKANIDEFFYSYGLSQNPFPPNRMIVSQIIYGQDQGLKRFLDATAEIMTSKEPQRRALAVVAGTGGGKTHFLSYCHYAFPRVATKFNQKFVQSSFAAGSGKMIDLLRNVLRDADEFCRTSEGCDFIPALIGELQIAPDQQALLKALSNTDLRLSLEALLASNQTANHGNSKFDLLVSITRKWISAETLSPSEKRQLGVISRISNLGTFVKVIKELFSLARSLNLFHGLFLSIDEIETLFTRGLSLAQIQTFLQDIRYFYDESVRDNKGFDFLLVTASTTTGMSNLERYSQPIFQRFGYETHILLSDIDTVAAAVDFANKYIEFYHSKWKEQNTKKVPQKSPNSLVTAKEIESVFAKGTRKAPAAMLDALHKLVQEKRAE